MQLINSAIYLRDTLHLPSLAVPEMEADSLIRTLKKYDASFDVAAIKSAFPRHGHGHSRNSSIGHDLEEDGQNSGRLASWVASHVTPDTLLSVDELNQ